MNDKMIWSYVSTMPSLFVHFSFKRLKFQSIFNRDETTYHTLIFCKQNGIFLSQTDIASCTYIHGHIIHCVKKLCEKKKCTITVPSYSILYFEVINIGKNSERKRYERANESDIGVYH
jgi:hypothetical protein